jgi:agmatinase
MRILNAMPPHNLFGVEDSSYEKAKVAALPVPYDSTSSYRTGSREGPNAIIEASRNIEPYSMETGSDPSGLVYTLEPLMPDFSSPESMVKRIGKEVSLLLDDGKVPLLLGGEHTIAVGAVAALARRGQFTVLHFDAHSDSRQELFGTRYCHACAMARIRELCRDYYSIGVRSVDRESAERRDRRIIPMEEVHGMTMHELAASLARASKRDIYLTFDLDVLDPSEMPSTGTPEPDGMRFRDVMQLFSELLPKKRLVGMDFTELMPIPGFTAPDFLAAKLIYNTLAFAYGKKAGKKA